MLVAQFIGLFPEQVIHDVIIINIDIFNVIFLFELIVCDEQGLGWLNQDVVVPKNLFHSDRAAIPALSMKKTVRICVN